ncbi:tyrosine-type recombinase/integrase [Clostridium botulinum]|nr:tyrosine-type recombinase/integrase [Clostridium botulinum]EKS4395860.1 tyrosine-type recombinase/integrase [Clostridium botulinum]
MRSFNSCKEEFLLVKRSERRSIKTIKCYNYDLDRFKRYLLSKKIDISDINKINKFHIISYLNYLTYDKKKWDDHKFNSNSSNQVGLSNTSVNNIRRNLKVFFKYLYKEEIIEKDPIENISSQKEDRDKIEIFSKEQVEELLDSPNKHTFTGFRDFLMMLIMLDNGIRINELCNVKIRDIDFQRKIIKINDKIAKNKKQRFIPISDIATNHIKTLIKYCRLESSDYLILNQYGEQLTTGCFAKNLKKYGQICNIYNVRVSPHTLRHTFATNYLLNGGDVFSLQSILGHSSIDMVKRYIHYTEGFLNKVQNKCTPLTNIYYSDNSSSEKKSKKRIMFNML